MAASKKHELFEIHDHVKWLLRCLRHLVVVVVVAAAAVVVVVVVEVVVVCPVVVSNRQSLVFLSFYFIFRSRCRSFERKTRIASISQILVKKKFGFEFRLRFVISTRGRCHGGRIFDATLPLWSELP